MLDESSLQFSEHLVANLERPNLQDVTGVVESGKSRAKHDSNSARPRLALEMDRFAPDRDRRVPVVLREKISAGSTLPRKPNGSLRLLRLRKRVKSRSR